MPQILGVTLDFYQTLVRHRAGSGRGAALMEYLAAEGLAADPWEHKVLYDAFEFYGSDFRPNFTAAETKTFWEQFTDRLFDRIHVRGAEPVSAAAHADAVSQLMGPPSLALYDDVMPTLEWLKSSGLRKGIVSNWQKGLSHFCRELGILDYMDFVVVSAEVGFQKPDVQMFEIASQRLGLPPQNILHIGDNPIQDVAAALSSGFQCVHLMREDSVETPVEPVIASLREVAPIVQKSLGSA